MHARPCRPRRARLLAASAVVALLGGLAACGTVTVPAGPAASDPLCAEIVLGAPHEMLGLERSETSSQGTVAWGSGEDTVVLRCGVEPPGPTTDACTRLEDPSGVQVDWIVREQDEIVLLTTYGRVPAVDISVPRSVAPDQPSAAALDMGRLVDATIPAIDHCVGAGDVS
nr:DUF3515 family protein [Brachybacterium muris]